MLVKHLEWCLLHNRSYIGACGIIIFPAKPEV